MNEFLFGAAVVAIISTLVGAFLWFHAEKQIKEYKKRTGQQ
jgi:hypothetical protein